VLVTTTIFGNGVGENCGEFTGFELTTRWRVGVGDGAALCAKTEIERHRETHNPVKILFFILPSSVLSFEHFGRDYWLNLKNANGKFRNLKIRSFYKRLSNDLLKVYGFDKNCL
jgi:hypothetical protein